MFNAILFHQVCIFYVLLVPQMLGLLTLEILSPDRHKTRSKRLWQKISNKIEKDWHYDMPADDFLLLRKVEKFVSGLNCFQKLLRSTWYKQYFGSRSGALQTWSSANIASFFKGPGKLLQTIQTGERSTTHIKDTFILIAFGWYLKFTVRKNLSAKSLHFVTSNLQLNDDFLEYKAGESRYHKDNEK
jgi:hypothetical protein